VPRALCTTSAAFDFCGAPITAANSAKVKIRGFIILNKPRSCRTVALYKSCNRSTLAILISGQFWPGEDQRRSRTVRRTDQDVVTTNADFESVCAQGFQRKLENALSDVSLLQKKMRNRLEDL
jgi:hypothetical protein